ncbi:MAG: hypothetical protein IPP14_11595 [Planctomycetes bacterium]|nr:hypothetical protein [Planctomycetota bacterium]
MKINGATLAIGGLAAAVVVGGLLYVSKKPATNEALLPPDSGAAALTADAQARLAEAQSRERQAELAAEVRKAELKALDKPIGDRLLDFALDTGKGFIGSLGSSLFK